jgi:DNA-binding MarR family transcriptional regulator
MEYTPLNTDIKNSYLIKELFQFIKRLPRLSLHLEHTEGLTRSEYSLLTVLRFNISEERKILSASEITSLMQITPAAGTHLFNPLERAGYIYREPDLKDRRVSLIGLTEKGFKLTDELIADVQDQLNGLIELLGEEDSKTFVRLLSKVYDYLSV